jgi:hypothetical protein
MELGLVEAAGFEPASRDIFMQASTYIVDSLVLANDNSARQDLKFAILKLNLDFCVSGMTKVDLDL